MRRRRRPTLAACAAVLALALAGCGSDVGDDEVEGGELTVHVSLPLAGPSGERGRQIENGAKLALAESGGRAGGFTISALYGDDSGREQPRWDPVVTAENARRAAQDSTAIAYIGEFESGATRISLPITNQAGMLHVSPASTAVGLTRSAAGTGEREPDRYYPSGNRTFSRVVPPDDLAARAAARWAQRLGHRRIAVVSDGEVFGEVLAFAFEREAERLDLEVTVRDSVTDRPADAARAAGAIERTGSQAAYYAGGADHGLPFLRAMRAAAPGVELLGSDAFLLARGFPRKLGELEVRVTSPALPAAELPGGRGFARDYEREFGEPPGPYAAFGYEAMAAVIAAIERAGTDGNLRSRVIESFFATADRDSILGTYTIDAHGDPTLNSIAGYLVRGSELRFDRVLKVK